MYIKIGKFQQVSIHAIFVKWLDSRIYRDAHSFYIIQNFVEETIGQRLNEEKPKELRLLITKIGVLWSKYHRHRLDSFLVLLVIKYHL